MDDRRVEMHRAMMRSEADVLRLVMRAEAYPVYPTGVDREAAGASPDHDASSLEHNARYR